MIIFFYLITFVQSSLLEEWRKDIYNMDAISAQNNYKQIIKSPLSDLSNFYYLYALYIFYGLSEDINVDYTRVYYWISKSADLGNVDALFYRGLLSHYKLDGTFNLHLNLEIQGGPNQLEQYLKYRHLSLPLIDFYFSAIQGNNKSAQALSYRYMRGLGVQRNCSNSVLLMLDLTSEHFIQNDDRYLYQNWRVDYALFNGYYLLHPQFDQKNDDIGMNYYFGINGYQRDEHKAFKIFRSQMELDIQKKAKVAQMIIEGYGDESYDYQLAFQLFTEVAVLNEPRGFNGLGYMYMNGLGVRKNIIKGMNYFKKAADMNLTDGHYNYGVAFLQPSTQDLERNKRIAYHHLNIAANQGHALAQYTLSLILLDGVDFYYSCDLAVRLLHQSYTRSHIAKYVNNGNYLFNQGYYQRSFAYYLVAATIGLHTSISNAAILSEQFKAIQNSQIDYASEYIRHDEEDPFSYLFKDILQTVNNDKELLRNLLKIDDVQANKTISNYIANKLYGYCKIGYDPSCYMRYADQFYYGQYEIQNYEQAFSLYKETIQLWDIPDFIKGQAYFNLAYMTYMGEGNTENYENTFEYFNKSIHSYAIIPKYTIPYLHQLYSIQNITQFIQDSTSFDNLQGKYDILLNIMIIFTVIFLYGVKVRLENL